MQRLPQDPIKALLEEKGTPFQDKEQMSQDEVFMMPSEVNNHIIQLQEASRPLRVTAIGGAGVGKSTLGNVLLKGQPQDGVFKSEDAPEEGGVTREVEQHEGFLFGNYGSPKLSYVDVPGLSDYTLSLANFCNSLAREAEKNQSFDAIIIAIKATDCRFDIAQIMAAKFIQEMFEQFDSKNLWLCVTHCDLYKGAKENQNFIRPKLAKLAEIGLQICEQNIIYFDFSANSLRQFVESISVNRGNIKLKSNIQFNFFHYMFNLDKEVEYEYKKYNDNSLKQNYSLYVQLIKNWQQQLWEDFANQQQLLEELKDQKQEDNQIKKFFKDNKQLLSTAAGGTAGVFTAAALGIPLWIALLAGGGGFGGKWIVDRFINQQQIQQQNDNLL